MAGISYLIPLVKPDYNKVLLLASLSFFLVINREALVWLKMCPFPEFKSMMLCFQ